MNNDIEEKLLSLREAAEYLGFREKQMLSRTEIGRIRFTKRDGNDYLFSMSDLRNYERRKWLEDNRPVIVLGAIAIVALIGIGGWFGFKFVLHKMADRSVQRADALLKKKDFNGAAHLLRSATQSDPGNIEARMAYARLLGASNQMKEQETQLLAALDSNPNNLQVLENLGVLEMRLNNIGRADDYFKRALHQQPNHFLSLYSLAVVASKRGDDAEARTYLSRALKIQPGFDPALRLEADLMANEGKLNEALRAYGAVKKASLDAVLNRGILLEKTGDLQGARAVYNDVVLQSPVVARAYNNLAWSLVGRDAAPDAATLKQAFLLARKAYLLNPNDASTLDTLGWIFFLSGKTLEANELIDRALKLEPRVAVTHYHKARILLQLHKPVEAETALRTARKHSRGTTDVSIKTIDKLLRQIRDNRIKNDHP